MPRRCIVKDCLTGSRKIKDEANTSLFIVPSEAEMRDKWKQAIPEISDDILTQQYVCKKHFEPDLVVAEYIRMGTSQEYQRRNRLSWKAVPTLCLFEPVVSQEPVAESVSAPVAVNASDHTYADNNQQRVLEELIDKTVGIAVINSECMAITEGLPFPTAIELPKFWNVTDLSVDNNERIYFTHVITTHETLSPTASVSFAPYVDKAILIDEHRNIQYFVNNKPIVLATKKCPNVLYNVKSLAHIIRHFENQRICQGLGLEQTEFIDLSTAYKDGFNIWRDNNCTMLATTKFCPYCCKLLNKIKLKMANAGQEIPPPQSSDKVMIKTLREKLILERRLKQKALMKVMSVTTALGKSKEKIALLKAETIHDKCAALKISPRERLVINEILSAAAKKDSTGCRYSDEWLDIAMQMRLRSPSFYNYLRDSKILPLPCMKTVTKYASSLVAKSGVEAVDGIIVETIEYDISDMNME